MGIAKVLLQSELLFYEHVVYRLRVPRWQNETDEAHVAVKIVMQKSIHSVWAFQTRKSKSHHQPSRGSGCVVWASYRQFMPQKHKRNAKRSNKRSLRLYNPLKPRIFHCEGVAAISIATTAAGVINYVFHKGDFGFAGATYPIGINQMFSESTYQVRMLAATMKWAPFLGRSASQAIGPTGAGSGLCSLFHESSTPTINYFDLLSALGWQIVYNGKPFSHSWREQNVSESLWYSGAAVSLSTTPDPGFAFCFYTTGGPVSQAMGTVFFSFVMEVRCQ
jgi:hypothetical protein